MITNTIRLIKRYKKAHVYAESKGVIETNMQLKLTDDDPKLNTSQDMLIHMSTAEETILTKGMNQLCKSIES